MGKHSNILFALSVCTFLSGSLSSPFRPSPSSNPGHFPPNPPPFPPNSSEFASDDLGPPCGPPPSDFPQNLTEFQNNASAPCRPPPFSRPPQFLSNSSGFESDAGVPPYRPPPLSNPPRFPPDSPQFPSRDESPPRGFTSGQFSQNRPEFNPGFPGFSNDDFGFPGGPFPQFPQNGPAFINNSSGPYGPPSFSRPPQFPPDSPVFAAGAGASFGPSSNPPPFPIADTPSNNFSPPSFSRFKFTRISDNAAQVSFGGSDCQFGSDTDSCEVFCASKNFRQGRCNTGNHCVCSEFSSGGPA
ncbi:proline-rich proteoglycan 2-like [Hermetia illucens]|uniref:proline-rich proteoglycan 2-like n=1 Tax=Hermetia illucens TaxID=343691 RepID=UPI0018CC3849|nr:proline-rich proteoglycan 2-like [Hermetia illucens]